MAIKYKLEIESTKERLMKKVNKLTEAIVIIRKKYEEDKQFSGIIKCPECGGELYYTIAPTNLHVWGKCKTPKCLEWMM